MYIERENKSHPGENSGAYYDQKKVILDLCIYLVWSSWHLCRSYPHHKSVDLNKILGNIDDDSTISYIGIFLKEEEKKKCQRIAKHSTLTAFIFFFFLASFSSFFLRSTIWISMDFATFNSAFIPHGKWLWGELSELAQRYRIFSSYYYKREKINKISRSRELIQVPFLHRREFVIFYHLKMSGLWLATLSLQPKR